MTSYIFYYLLLLGLFIVICDNQKIFFDLLSKLGNQKTKSKRFLHKNFKTLDNFPKYRYFFSNPIIQKSLNCIKFFQFKATMKPHLSL